MQHIQELTNTTRRKQRIRFIVEQSLVRIREPLSESQNRLSTALLRRKKRFELHPFEEEGMVVVIVDLDFEEDEGALGGGEVRRGAGRRRRVGFGADGERGGDGELVDLHRERFSNFRREKGKEEKAHFSETPADKSSLFSWSRFWLRVLHRTDKRMLSQFLQLVRDRRFRASSWREPSGCRNSHEKVLVCRLSRLRI
jgi:hypothetical protein